MEEDTEKKQAEKTSKTKKDPCKLHETNAETAEEEKLLSDIDVSKRERYIV